MKHELKAFSVRRILKAFANSETINAEGLDIHLQLELK